MCKYDLKISDAMGHMLLDFSVPLVVLNIAFPS